MGPAVCTVTAGPRQCTRTVAADVAAAFPSGRHSHAPAHHGIVDRNRDAVPAKLSQRNPDELSEAIPCWTHSTTRNGALRS